MEIFRQIDCVPTIVVCYDSMYKPAQPGGFAPSRATLFEAAREWVRYANITRGYNVQYWEIETRAICRITTAKRRRRTTPETSSSSLGR